MATTTDWIRGLLAFTRCLRRSDADLQQHYYHLSHAFTSGDPWHVRPDSAFLAKWRDNADEWNANNSRAERTRPDESGVRDKGPLIAADLIQSILENGEQARREEKRDVATISLRVTLSDGGVYIHSTRTFSDDDGDA
jgi:hypothetical protein